MAKVAKLKLSELREIEREFGMFLGDPRKPKRCPNQQFGIYAPDDYYINDICAEGTFFSADELRKKIDKAVTPGC
jgi:hypothetical protein